MSTAQLIVVRYFDLVDSGKIEPALAYLANDVIYNTWLGVVEGKDNVTSFLRDNVRYMHNARNFSPWRQVQHSLDPALHFFTAQNGSVPYDDKGYDSQGFAMFERDGTIASLTKLSMKKLHVKETAVVKDGYIILVNLSKRF
ncbi:hypothetical protein STCU_01054 [Strigomonas culicis]|uniref:SnoaL-like domain-containing protein n=1 Tax=Strigomonas culicis TaxID=28005 RepID=S9UPY1_9TRYP|nr:hypothetical protein STCU_03765 [Strigomonas culicis]EPY32801.1 hypothetical protein STCU_02636 [Strigomonas culicis]EPY33594.1 hypothetical protein STCU_02140 [Strigomonas culicis]EPY35620.1 hypothetical protein STCU_01054 [Strigomonas culicis]|eukprot:EPY30938.1 hypothetical protein STCU_03765 [Strigomonas culicis]